jgi:hypothetical protein
MSLPPDSNSWDVLFAGNCFLHMLTEFFRLFPTGNVEGLVILLLFLWDACSVESTLCCSLVLQLSARKLQN